MRLVFKKSLIVKRCSIEKSLRKNDFGKQSCYHNAKCIGGGSNGGIGATKKLV
jgi:hypothetical protein